MQHCNVRRRFIKCIVLESKLVISMAKNVFASLNQLIMQLKRKNIKKCY